MNSLNHVAFIMDGNGRWGEKKRKGRNYGHLKGLDTVKNIVGYSIKLKIPFVTFYVFSTENWKRPKSEINFLFRLIENYFSKEIKSIIKQEIKLNLFGDLKKLPKKIQMTLKKSLELTNKNKKIVVNLAINYGSKSEIINAFKKIKNKKNISINDLSKNLYSRNIPDPDILIRTGGHKRLSNFLLWQLAYSEIFFEKKLWPDFNQKDYNRIINTFKYIKRNFGKI
jgi:undecaprenyl diphosphate synthase